MKKNIPVFLSSDNNYAPFVATTIASVCDHTKSFCDFYVLDGGIIKENKEKICELKKIFSNFSIEFICVHLEKIFSHFSTGIWGAKSIYGRLLIPQIEKKLGKVLYLDVDVVVLGDIKELYEQNLNEYILGAVVDQGNPILVNGAKEYLEMNLKNNYFNAGVLLIDCKRWREERITERCFEIEKKYRNLIKMADQDILNKCFDGVWFELDKKFNVMYDNCECVVRHFANRIKPWQADFILDPFSNKPIRSKNIDDFWKYVKKTDFYDELIEKKKKFLNSNFLYKRFNRMVEDEKI